MEYPDYQKILPPNKVGFVSGTKPLTNAAIPNTYDPISTVIPSKRSTIFAWLANGDCQLTSLFARMSTNGIRDMRKTHNIAEYVRQNWGYHTASPNVQE